MKHINLHTTHFSLQHVERLTVSLRDIIEEICERPVSIDICLGTVRAGLCLFRKASYTSDTYIGYPWSTSAALNFLAGLGYVSDPRLALEAIQLLEQRHIVDRRRIADRTMTQPRPERRSRWGYDRGIKNAARTAVRLASRP